MVKHMSALVIALFAASAAAAPPKGAYKIVSANDGKTTTVIDDMFKKDGARGELVLTFDGNKISVGMWQVAKGTDDKTPGVIYLSACRGEATGTGKWTGDTLKLD